MSSRDVKGTTERMVFRSFYLPRGLDEQLRVFAFEHRKSKAEIIRELLIQYFDSLKKQECPEKSANSKLI